MFELFVMFIIKKPFRYNWNNLINIIRNNSIHYNKKLGQDSHKIISRISWDTQDQFLQNSGQNFCLILSGFLAQFSTGFIYNPKQISHRFKKMISG